MDVRSRFLIGTNKLNVREVAGDSCSSVGRASERSRSVSPRSSSLSPPSPDSTSRHSRTARNSEQQTILTSNTCGQYMKN
jgi:hypothetical protein